MIFVIDNYDSFTFNLVQYIKMLGWEVTVARNDRTSPGEIESAKPEALVISPGPCTPDRAGICLEAVRELAAKMPILGVCLGHQAVAQAFGAKIVRAGRLMHGKTSLVRHDGKTIYRKLPNPFEAGRYHSLIVEADSLPDCLSVTATTEEGEIMGVRHKRYPIEGIQFHPESVLTPVGMAVLKNFLELAAGRRGTAQAGAAC